MIGWEVSDGMEALSVSEEHEPTKEELLAMEAAGIPAGVAKAPPRMPQELVEDLQERVALLEAALENVRRYHRDEAERLSAPELSSDETFMLLDVHREAEMFVQKLQAEYLLTLMTRESERAGLYEI